MQKAQNKESDILSKYIQEVVYKEFIRKKYLRYSHTIPRFIQSQIYKKIYKEWSLMSEKEKKQCYNSYCLHKFIEPVTNLLNDGNNQPQQQNENHEMRDITVSHQIEQKDERQHEILKQRRSERAKKARKMKNVVNSSVSDRQVKEQDQNEDDMQLNDYQLQSMAPKFMLGQSLTKKIKTLNENDQQFFEEYKTILQNLKQQNSDSIDSIINQILPSIQQKVQQISSNRQLLNQQIAKQNTKQQQNSSNESQQLSSEEVFVPKMSKCQLKQIKKNEMTSYEYNEDSSITQKAKKVPKTNPYLQFYKKGYKKIKESCPGLTGNQITMILTTIWQKHKCIKQIAKKQSQSKYNKNLKQLEIKNESLMEILCKKIARRNFIKYKESKGINENQGIILWNRLPIESKYLWIYPKSPNLDLLRQRNIKSITGTLKYNANNISSKTYQLQDWNIFQQNQILRKLDFQCIQEALDPIS